MTDLNVKRTKVIVGSSILSLLLAVTLFTIKTSSQQLRAGKLKPPSDLLARIDKSPGLPLRVLENDDSPLRIVDAKVKEISGAEFTILTGTTTNLPTVPSLPEATLLNSSGKTITTFVVAVRDPISRSTRGFIQNQVKIRPGDTYLISPDHFVDAEKLTVANETGQVSQSVSRVAKESPKYWLQLGSRTDLFITIGRVNFEDGSNWKIKGGAELQ